jgi:transposase
MSNYDESEYAGVDLGATEHFWCVVGGPKNKVLRRGHVPNTQDGYLKLREGLRNIHTGEIPPVAMESERGLFPLTLQAEGVEVLFVSPLQTASLRGALGMGKDKSDKRDAEAIAHGVRISADRIRQMRGVTEHIRALHSATRGHLLAQNRVEQSAHVLRSHLAEYWPAFVTKYDATELRRQTWTRRLVAAYPTHRALAAATDDDLRNVLIAAGRERRIDWSITNHIRPLVDQTVLHYPPFTEAQYGRITGMLVAQLDASATLVDQLEAQVRDLYLSHPLSNLLDTIPGVGLLTGARILAEIGDDPFRFPRTVQLQAYGGCRPQTNASGGRTSVVRRRARNPVLERAVTSLAGQIVIKRRGDTPPLSPGASWLYAKAAGREGKSMYHGQRVVGQRLLGGLWHCMTYAARRPERGLPFADWSDAKLFAREYTEMHAAGADGQPTQSLNLEDRDHRRGWTPITAEQIESALLHPTLALSA